MLNYASITKRGNRKCNEDCFKISYVSNRYCFVVCDGLGGHKAGNIAAKIAVDAFVDEFYFCENLADYLPKAFSKAQKQILLRQKENITEKDMKTTAVCLVADETTAYVGHIGDSRFYGFKKDGAYICTADHSVPQLLVQSNTITESEIRNHPNRNMLLRVMGDECDDSSCELQQPLPLCEFSAFLLCTDGFWESVTENDMILTLRSSNSPQEWLNKMITVVEADGRNKEMDNYTAIAVYVRSK